MINSAGISPFSIRSSVGRAGPWIHAAVKGSLEKEEDVNWSSDLLGNGFFRMRDNIYSLLLFFIAKYP